MNIEKLKIAIKISKEERKSLSLKKGVELSKIMEIFK